MDTNVTSAKVELPVPRAPKAKAETKKEKTTTNGGCIVDLSASDYLITTLQRFGIKSDFQTDCRGDPVTLTTRSSDNETKCPGDLVTTLAALHSEAPVPNRNPHASVSYDAATFNQHNGDRRPQFHPKVQVLRFGIKDSLDAYLRPHVEPPWQENFIFKLGHTFRKRYYQISN